jgi:FKBP-type peptidyl-prolyl cis-trans isomerase FkpA
MKRVTSFVLALIIFGSAVASAIFVLQAIREEQDTSQTASTESVTETTTQEQTQEEQPVNENQLEGTQLANFAPSPARVTELKVEDIKVGTGAEVTATGTVTAHYTGALVATGVIFQSSKDTGSEFTAPLSNLIEGWQKGIPGMKVGGVRRITIPAAQAYGSTERPGIPADSDLVFDIELSATE